MASLAAFRQRRGRVGRPSSIRIITALIGVLAILGLTTALDQALRHGGIAWNAAPGDDVALPGGRMRVEAVIPEQLAPMNHERFARLGMAMSAMVPDSTPEGQRTFTVLLSLVGQGPDGLDVRAERFSVSAPGLGPIAPLRSDMGTTTVPPGSGMTGTLVFRVPADAETLSLRYDGAYPIVLQLGEAPKHH